MRRVFFASTTLAIGLVIACSDFGSAPGEEEATSAGPDATARDATDEGTPPVSADASSDAPPVDQDPRCPIITRGPRLIFVAGVCIDETEVTNAQYAAYWTNRDSSEVRPQECQTVSPQQGNGQQGISCSSEQNPAYPVACVTWCDAYAYCAWAGKRLCRGVGGKDIPFDNRDSQANEWMAACTNGGTQSYATGATWDPQAGCRTVDDKIQGPVPAALGCLAPSGVHHLAGNVGEWLDVCEANVSTPRDAQCAVAGETFHYRIASMPAGTCTTADHDTRSTAYYDLGFRCCADPREP